MTPKILIFIFPLQWPVKTLFYRSVLTSVTPKIIPQNTYLILSSIKLQIKLIKIILFFISSKFSLNFLPSSSIIFLPIHTIIYFSLNFLQKNSFSFLSKQNKINKNWIRFVKPRTFIPRVSKNSEKFHIRLRDPSRKDQCESFKIPFGIKRKTCETQKHTQTRPKPTIYYPIFLPIRFENFEKSIRNSL